MPVLTEFPENCGLCPGKSVHKARRVGQRCAASAQPWEPVLPGLEDNMLG